MFYCKDVKYDMCELKKKKKIMIRKIKYAKNLMTWLFIGHMFSFTISFRLYDRRAAERVRHQGCLIVAFTRHQLQKKSFQMTSKDS